MRKNAFWLPMAATVMALTTACTDSNYDLSDIDTNVKVSTNDLVIPINLDKVKLDAILDIDTEDPDGKIKKVYDAETKTYQYAVVVEDEFKSGEIKLEPITVGGGQFGKQDMTAGLKSNKAGVKGKKAPGSYDYYYELTGSEINLTKYEGEIDLSTIDVDKIEDITLDFTVKTTLNIAQQLKDKADQAHLESLAFKLIEGMEGYRCFEGYIKIGNEQMTLAEAWDIETSIINFSKTIAVNPADPNTIIELHVDKIYGDAIRHFIDVYHETAKKAGKRLAPGTKEHFLYEANIRFEDGFMGLKEEELKENVTAEELPVEIVYQAVPSTEGMKITKFSGHVNYDLAEKLDIPTVELNDLPELLTEIGTEVKLKNPQLYIQLDNPVKDGAGKVVQAQSGFSFTNIYTDASGKKCESKPITLASDAIKAKKESNFFCLSPNKVDKMYAGFEGAEYVPFADLSNILSTNGNGLPKSINIQALGAMVDDEVTDIDLDQNYGKATGKYIFYVPLALAEGSKIVYNKLIDGWGSDDLDKLTITQLKVKVKVSTDVPLALKMSATPINSKGQHISGVSTASCEIPANAKGQEVTLQLTGNIKDLDGIDFKAEMISNGSDKALSPDMNIELSNIRACVTGSYTTEL